MAKATGTDLKPATLEQYAILTGEIALAVAKAQPSFALMQRLATNKTAKRRALATALKALEMELIPDPRLTAEQQFWVKLGVAVEIDDLMVPECPADFTEIAIIPASLTNEQLFVLCAKHFPSWKYYDDLDKCTAQQARPTNTYAVGYRGGVEPDLEHRNKSYDVATKEGLIFMNPKERLVAELRYFVRTGRHLDEKGWTITSSLASGGCALCAGWYPSSGTFDVDGYGRSCAGSADGPRQAVFA
ncbi:MAG: hypothetical protein A3C93_04075 [Candidatus Lloydbacteria bacterium RIFCSPHIGHO2_02_FULL_54_17]|uniref:Uncharacterized protein n=1 Tax=Candidatus Lloydbacteria bacterium RIFCSPHIGHO2_02_FULL_54_17 TaxID=1798664 RepID=A0A1G2DBG3_9BACT|nr:MAG: hypothetical protein A3C93_04075 [Candidatus Lloydbacteria bacterium RIFCSPHIGHO2_02_FULL_54_17]